ncbi:MAG TPA: MotA/TolQ/ExbB proton channel family protein, partial [Polyangiaceae bacterium]|nr:MotA/TolQ/ExbB proton channel family protein [Polyangiaceae bacterium]
ERSTDSLLEVGAAPILYLMIALSIISVAVMLERAWFFFVSSEDLAGLARALDEKLSAGDLAGARELTENSRSIEGAIVRAGLANGERGADAASEAMASATAIGRLRLERRLSFLGTLGNNAPFVGLLGTVIGIVQAFHELERAGMGGSASADIMGAIAEALVATAIGLAVAIPAVAAFNYFQRRIKTTLGNAEALEHIVLSHLKGGTLPVEQAQPVATSRPVRLSLGGVPFSAAPSIER